ncbi:MAG: hypothetical protein ACI8ZF_000722 [Candidatus Midichloriaceae bacterium]|jgi:hypothetical protein
MDDIQKALSDSILYDNDKLLSKFVVDKHDILDELIDIYRNNYYSNLTNALEISYPTVKKLLGEECFEVLCRKYIKITNTNESNLLLYGSDFASYIKGIEELKYIGYLSDAAKLDYLRDKIYHAYEEKSLEIDDLNSIGSKIVKLKNHIELLNSEYDIDFIYNYCYSEQLQKEEFDKNKITNKTFLLVFKHNNKISQIKLSEFEWHFFEQLKSFNDLEKTLALLVQKNQNSIEAVLAKALKLKLLTYL